MDAYRPDPDQLLERLRDDAVRAARGRLKLFFGASAGVGKTCAMLAAARQVQSQGSDVAIGVVETHGRAETAALAEGFACIPLRTLEHRGRNLQEFDLDAALLRRPALLLLDELAHSNLPGSRHPKRWQDVEDLLAAGIDVWSTLNVQHLESLAEVVGGITGIRVWETVPDPVFDAADEVVLVDLPPDELLQRLRDGKVYLPQQAERAIRNFFRKGNLLALRELALRRTADRVDGEMIRYRREAAVSTVWQTRDALLVCLQPETGAEALVRQALRMAARLDAPWHVVTVETPHASTVASARRHAVRKALRTAQEHGAVVATLSGSDVASALVDYAREHNLGRIAIGRGSASRWWFAPGLGERLGQLAPDLDVIEVGSAAASAAGQAALPAGDHRPSWRRLRAPWPAFAMSAVHCAAATLIALPLHALFDLANIAMLFLLAVVITAARHGLGPAVAAAFLNVAAFDFFFVPPRFSFAVSDVQYLLTFAVMLVVGLITAQLTSGLKFQAAVAQRREQRVRALYELARDLSAALLPQQIAELSARFAERTFHARTALLLTDDTAQPGLAGPADGTLEDLDRGIAQWALEHEREAGAGTDTLPGNRYLYLPLRAPMRMRGILVLEPAELGHLQAPEQRALLDTFTRLVAIALERIHYVDVAQSTTVLMESERLRNSLLAAISHDLRTPLTAMVGLSDALLLTDPAPTPEQTEIAECMREEVLRMNALANNLLDMARLQSGTVRLDLQWQDLEEVVGSALKAAHSLLTGHHIVVALPADLPMLAFDAVLIERVLVNLLDNAAKYTPPGSHITIGAGVRDAEWVEIWVADDGPGLPAGRERAIFEKFERGRKETSTPGVGLGLAICRAIVECHGGHIHAEPAGGGGAAAVDPRDAASAAPLSGGARFVFTLPRGTPPTLPETRVTDPDEAIA